MIKNVVFDFGQVLVHFEPEKMVAKYVREESDARMLEEVLFDRLYWDALDAGTVTDEEVVATCRQRLPERLWEVADTIYYNWIYNLPEINGMHALVSYIKQRYGVRLFLLSNISKYFAAHRDEIPVLSEFEHCVFSAVVGKVKPNRDIFEHLCTVCNILPEETVFIDDSPKNVQGAVNAGLQAYLFDGNADALRAFLVQNGVLPA